MRTFFWSIAAVLAFALAGTALGQTTLVSGDVLISTSHDNGVVINSRIRVYSREGVLKGDFTSSDSEIFRETLVRNGIVYVGSTFDMLRFDTSGNFLGPFNPFGRINYLAPVGDGSFVAADGSGLLYHFNFDGSLRQFRNTQLLNERPARGVDVAADQCSTFYNSDDDVVLWNVCTGVSSPISASRMSGVGRGLRVLPDGNVLAAYQVAVDRLDSAGNLVRTYNIAANGIALDEDGTSFWTGFLGTLSKVNLETGAVEIAVNTGVNIDFISVVGEPRPGLQSANSIPTLSQWTLALLAIALGIFAFLRLP